MKKIFGVSLCLAGLMMTSCIFDTKKTETKMTDSLSQEVSQSDDSYEIGGSDVRKELNIYKIWISEDSMRVFDLRDDTHYIEAMKYDEEYCKENPDYQPGVYYISTEAGGFQVSHDFEEQGDSIGAVEYLIEQGPQEGTYALRFSFSNMTPTSATFLFEGEYEWKYTVMDKPVRLHPNPHPYVYEE